MRRDKVINELKNSWSTSVIGGVLLAAIIWMGGGGTAFADNDANLKIHYTFDDVSGTSVTDESGNGHTATLYNNASVIEMGKYHVLSLGNGTGYLDMGASAGNELTTTDNFTISAYCYVDKTASLSGAGYFLWAFSQLSANVAASGPYMAYRLNVQRFATSTGGYNNESGMEVGTAAAQGSWQHVLYRQKAATGELYVNGTLVGTNASMPVLKNVFTTATTYNWIGRAPFSTDNYLKNTLVYDFRFYSRAISDDSIAKFAANVSDLDYEYAYGTPGDFTAITTLLNKCTALMATVSSPTYPQTAIDELQDDIDVVEGLVNGKKASQTLLDNWQTTLQTAYDRLVGAKDMSIVSSEESGTFENNRGFIHPGCLNTQEDFDRVKAALAAGDATITKAYSNLTSNAYAQSGVTTYPVETIIRGGSSGQNYMNVARGAAMAYQNALCWKIGGDEAHAKTAVNILMAWANGCKYVSGDTNMSLAAGIYGYELVNAAELVRDYIGWSEEDFNKFKNWIKTVWYSKSIDFLRRRHDTWLNSGHTYQCPGHYWSNWGLCNALNVMSIGIFCDDPYIYNQGLSFYKYDQVGTFTATRTAPIINDGLTEFIGNLVPDVHDDARGPYGKLGQMQESGRDQGHALMALGLSVDICQTGWNQGDDLFSYMDNRLAAGIEHVAALNFCGVASADMPWTAYWYHDRSHSASATDSWQMTGDNTGGLGGWRPYWSRIIGHYEGVKGVKMRYSEKADSIVGIDDGGGSYGQTSGGFDHLGFSTLMCSRPAVTADMAPIVLQPTIVYNGTTYEQSELGGLKNTYAVDNNTGVTKGSKIQLIPLLPDGVADTGNWLWSTGETTKNIEITADESKLYRVYFTNSNNVRSSLLYTIAVQGDCTSDVITPAITVDGVTTNDTVVTVMTQHPVTLTVYNSSGWGTYKWSNGETTSSITVSNINADRTYTVNYLNQGGHASVLNFHIHTYVMTPSIAIDTAAAQAVDHVIVSKGDKVTLKPVTSAENIYGSWKWSDGSTDRNLVLDDIQSTKTYTVVYTLGNTKDTLSFKVYMAQAAKSIADGNYLVKNANADTYLTNIGTLVPAFRALTGDSTQLWNVTKDGEGFKITYVLNGKYLNKYGRFTTTDYDSTLSTYLFYGVDEGDYYAIQNMSAAGGKYWGITASGALSGTASATLNGYPFEFIPIINTAVESTLNDDDVNIRVNNDMMTVSVGKEASLRLTSVGGSTLMSSRCMSGDNDIDISKLSPGLYLATVKINDCSKTMKIVKK